MPDINATIGLDRSAFATGLTAVENEVKGFGGKVTGILAGAFSVGTIMNGISTAINKGDQLQDLANRFGLVASSIQEIGNTASLSGGSIEDVAAAMGKLAKNAGSALGGNEAMQESFAKIGVSMDDLRKMNPQDLFMALSKAVASGSLGMQDFTIASELAGRGVGSLMETLRMGPDAISVNGQAMGVWANSTIAALSQAKDALTTFSNLATIGFGLVTEKAMQALEAYARFAVIKPLIKFFDDSRAPKPTRVMGDTDSEGSAAMPKAAERDKQKQVSLEERLADIMRRREMANADAEGKAGRIQAEAVALQVEINNLGDNKNAKLEKEIKLQELLIDLDNIRKGQAKDLADLMKEQANVKEVDPEIERGKRLRRENAIRGNDANFDPREMFIQRLGDSGLRNTATDMATPKVQDVNLQEVPGLDKVLEKLESLIKNAGVFS